MTMTSGQALKERRKASRLSVEKVAHSLGFSDTRSYYRYENDEMQNKDPAAILSAMKFYDDYSLGLIYLEENPVFREIFGHIPRYDLIHAATAFDCENDDDRQILPGIKKWALSGGQTPISNEYSDEVLDTVQVGAALRVAILSNKKSRLPVSAGAAAR